MLFNSYIFLLVFLPALYVIYLVLAGSPWARALPLVLLVFSLLFYGYHRPEYVLLVLASVSANYGFAVWLGQGGDALSVLTRRSIVAMAVAFNLALLGYFKYAFFAIEQFNAVAGADFQFEPAVLPLAISFYTFQQIGYVVDVYRGRAMRADFLRYFLFVLFFPQLIAGPICTSRELIPQLNTFLQGKRRGANAVVGLAIISVGLFKKVVIADTVGIYADDIFGQAAAGGQIALIGAWSGTLAFAFQIYFDFSGYSDMAVGLARLFGIRLPINFFSPYKADSISDFWRRWHITLSRFLRDYLYIPLGGSRVGGWSRYSNLIVVMILGGLWHGAGWTFVFWGALHGGYLAINHVWREVRTVRAVGVMPRAAARALTFLCVLVAWVLFRAEDLDSAGRVYAGMLGLNGIDLPWRLAAFLGVPDAGLPSWGVSVSYTSLRQLVEMSAILGVVLAGVWLLPNMYELIGRRQVLNEYIARGGRGVGALSVRLRTTPVWAAGLAMLLVADLLALLAGGREFLYFQF